MAGTGSLMFHRFSQSRSSRSSKRADFQKVNLDDQYRTFERNKQQNKTKQQQQKTQTKLTKNNNKNWKYT